MNSIAAAIIIYILGIVIGTMGFGAWMKPGKGIPFDESDYALFTILILIWPVCVALALIGGIIFGGSYIMLYAPIKGLLKFGEWIGEWPNRRKEALENAKSLKDKVVK